MHLTTAQLDRAAGVLLGTAAGDALGVPYEFESRVLRGDEAPQMLGGGLGDFAPGEWSDDTSMAMAIADVAATGADLTTDEALDAIADNFLRWFDGGPADIGIQTRAVLSATRRRLSGGGLGAGAIMREEANAYAEQHPHSAGNGALMRTAPVALAHLDDRDALADAARLVAGLTHADPLAGDSCVLWCEAIRVTVLDGKFDVRAGLDLLPDERVDQWLARRGCFGASEVVLAERVHLPHFNRRPRPSRRPRSPTRCRAVTCRVRSTPQSASATTPTPWPRSPAVFSAPGGVRVRSRGSGVVPCTVCPSATGVPATRATWWRWRRWRSAVANPMTRLAARCQSRRRGTLGDLHAVLRRPDTAGHRRTRLPTVARRSSHGTVSGCGTTIFETSIVITINRSVAEWGQVLGDTTVAAAMLDRLLHRSVVLKLDGDSYRLRDHHARSQNQRIAAARVRRTLEYESPTGVEFQRAHLGRIDEPRSQSPPKGFKRCACAPGRDRRLFRRSPAESYERNMGSTAGTPRDVGTVALVTTVNLAARRRCDGGVG